MTAEGKWIVPTTEYIRELANHRYGSDGEIEIDDHAIVSLSEDGNEGPQGAYVQAWVYVEFNKNPDYKGGDND
jgi:hypothetical protein